MSTRIAVTGDHLGEVVDALEARGFEVVREHPEMVFCSGGDGTFLRAERVWPGVPKVPARVAARAELCDRHRLEAVVERLSAGELRREELPKIVARIGHWRALALNDVVLRNAMPTVAARFEIELGSSVSGEITGDGLVVCTPFGSSAYYRSITGSTISTGLGVAFNNCTEARPPVAVPPGATLKVLLLRGPAVLVVDNDPRPTVLRAGHRFEVSGSDERAVALGLDALRCQDCRRSDGSRFNRHQASPAGAPGPAHQSK